MTQSQTALLLVDVQNDFCEGGALAVPDANAIFPTINRLIREAEKNGELIVASRDWHPVDHVSFDSRGGPWPPHCVQDTRGAAFHDGMHLPDSAVRVSKGTAFDTDAYSAFDGTELGSFLERNGVNSLRVAGLALDVCVRATALDGLRMGFGVELVADGCKAVDAKKAPEVLEELKGAGATIS